MGKASATGGKVQFRVSYETISRVPCVTNRRLLASSIALIINVTRVTRGTERSKKRVKVQTVLLSPAERAAFSLSLSLASSRAVIPETTKIVYFSVDHCEENFSLLIPLARAMDYRALFNENPGFASFVRSFNRNVIYVTFEIAFNFN